MQWNLGISRLSCVCCVVLIFVVAASCLRLPTVLGDVPESDISWRTLDWNELERVYGVYVFGVRCCIECQPSF